MTKRYLFLSLREKPVHMFNYKKDPETSSGGRNEENNRR